MFVDVFVCVQEVEKLRARMHALQAGETNALELERVLTITITITLTMRNALELERVKTLPKHTSTTLSPSHHHPTHTPHLTPISGREERFKRSSPNCKQRRYVRFFG